MAQGSHRPLLLLLVQDLELVLGQGLARLRHHLDHVHDQNLWVGRVRVMWERRGRPWLALHAPLRPCLRLPARGR